MATGQPQSEAPRPHQRRRARRACLACRSRKVRCDVVERSPCANCKWDNLECIVVGRRNGKYFRVNTPHPRSEKEISEDNTDTKSLSAKLKKMHSQESSESTQVSNCDAECEDVLVIDDTTPYESSSDPPGFFDQPPLLRDEDLQIREEPDVLNAYHKPSSISYCAPEASHTGPYGSSPHSILPELSDMPHAIPFPGFIKPLSTRMAADDLAYLTSKTALTLPSRKCQYALLWSFFEYVYPFMPIVDLSQFLEIVAHEDGSSGQLSLLLYQAVLFAGTAHVKIEHLKDAGFQTRKNARKAFFQRVRLLYDFNTESDRFILVQALLLMTLWYETPDEHRNTWYWIDVAISQCFATGLHRDPGTRNPPLPARMIELRRRIWWSCFQRDRLVSLGMRRPPRIKDDDYNVFMLTQADFHIEPLTGDDETYAKMCSYYNNPGKRESLASLCIANASLCRCLKHYLRPNYSIYSENTGDGSAEIFRLLGTDDKAIFTSSYEELLTWQNSLSPECRYQTLSHDIDFRGNASIALSRTLLHMTYYAAVLALHRTRFTLLLHSPGSSLYDQELSKICMQHAAQQISSMSGEIHKHCLDSLLPTTGITVVVSAAATHMLEIKGVIQADKGKAYEGYRQCMQVIGTLQDMYVAADLAKDAMEWAFIQPSSNGPMSTTHTSPMIESCSTPATDTVGLMGRSMPTQDFTPSESMSSRPSMLSTASFIGPGNGAKPMFEQAQMPFMEGLAALPLVDLESFQTSILFGDGAY